jgi:hypothetical protein
VKDEEVCRLSGLFAVRWPTGAWDMQMFLLDVAHASDRCHASSQRQPAEVGMAAD